MRSWWTAFLLLLPGVASAHFFGQQFVLPLPVNFYVYGGVSAFLASALVLLWFSQPRAATPKTRNVSLPQYDGFVRALRITTALTLVLGIGIGFLGSQSFQHNVLPNAFWIVFLLIFVYVSVLVGGLWEYLNPFATVPGPSTPKKPLPAVFSFLPALWLMGLLWLEFLSRGLGGIPSLLSTVLVAYSVVTVVGIRRYGAEAWFKEADFFSVFFRLVSSIAPVQLREKGIQILLPGAYLGKDASMSTLLLTLILLGGTVVDSLSETAIGSGFLDAGGTLRGLLALLAVVLTLLLFYVLAMWVVKKLTHSNEGVETLALQFAYSLLPIAVAYHFAHYMAAIPYLLYRVILPADVVWYVQLFVIVGGHIFAALVAHRIARETFPTARLVALSQLPMLVLMVAYTVFGLWTLSQPFV